MRLPSSACLLGRHSHRVLAQASSLHRIAFIPSFHHASSLSAIHHGLRQSEKARPQGFKPAALDTTRPPRTPLGPRHTRPNPRDPSWTPPNFKLKRGKKDVTDHGPERPTRRARFHDPTSGFGKRSMVYQMKHGNLRQELARMREEGTPSSHSSPRRGRGATMTSEDFMKNFHGAKERSPGDGGRYSNKPDKFHGQSAHRRSTFTEDRSGESSASGGRWGRDSQTRRDRDGGGFTPRRDRDGGGFTPRRDRDGGGFTPRRDREDTGFKPRQDRDDKGFRPRRDREERGSMPRETRGGREFRSQRDYPQSGLATDQGSFGGRRARESNEDRTSRDQRESRAADFPRKDRFGDKGAEPDGAQPPKARWEGSSREDGQSPRDDGDWSSTTHPVNRADGEASRGNDGPIRIHHTTAASQFLYGRSVVEAALKDSRRQLYKLYIYDGEDRRNVSQDIALEKLAARQSIQVEKVSRDGLRMMDKMSGGRPHNGCVLEASPLPQLPLKALGALSDDEAKPGFHLDIAHQSAEEAKINGTSDFVSFQLPKGRHPLVLLLDGILDPGNLGAIMRTAAFLGVNAVAITKGSSSTMTAVALKASAGASEVMTLFSVNSTLDFLERSKEAGWTVYAAVPGTTRSRNNSHITIDRVETYDPLSSQPTILVIGSEGEGLTKPVRRAADHEVSIPSPPGGFASVVDSLNVSVATGILCSAFLKKQSSDMIEIEETRTETATEDEEEQLW